MNGCLQYPFTGVLCIIVNYFQLSKFSSYVNFLYVYNVTNVANHIDKKAEQMFWYVLTF